MGVTKGTLIIAGKDGATSVPVKVDSQGKVEVSGDIGSATIATVQQGAKDASAEAWEVALKGSTANIGVVTQGANMVYGVTPTYMGLAKLGTLKYSGAEQALPTRPWQTNVNFSIIRNNAGTSANISFGDGNGEINIATDLFDVTLLKVGDDVVVSGAGEVNNNGTFEIVSFTSEQIVVDHAFTAEAVGATVLIRMGGNVVDRQGGTNLDNYTFDDTSATAANILQWHMFYDIIDGKPSLIYISDRVLVNNTSWAHIDGSGFISGTSVTIDGVDYICRSLAGGAANREGGGAGSLTGGLLPNEWDRYVMNGADDGGAVFTGAPTPENDDYLAGSQSQNNTARRRAHNQAWHWLNMGSLCQELTIDDSALFVFRGATTAREWASTATAFGSRGFRPVLVKEIEGGV